MNEKLQQMIGVEVRLILNKDNGLYINIKGILQYDVSNQLYEISQSHEGTTVVFWADHISAIAHKRIYLKS